jgi:sirohydrochlorin ferrochelatase
MTDRPPLVLVAHGSRDPRFAVVVESVAEQVRALQPALEVRVGYLDHGPPAVASVATAGAVAVPLLLASGYHVRVDLPAQAPQAVVAGAVGPDPRLAIALADRLRAAGWNGADAVTLAAAGSSDERSVADVHAAARQLAEHTGAAVRAAFLSAAQPRLDEVDRSVVATYLLAPGVFHDQLRSLATGVVSEPIGAHPLVAEIVLDRYLTTGQDRDGS